jgi:hypothetical protein
MNKKIPKLVKRISYNNIPGNKTKSGYSVPLVKQIDLLLPIKLDELILRDEKGKKIEGVKSVINSPYNDGIIVMADKNIFTNSKKLLKNRKI